MAWTGRGAAEDIARTIARFVAFNLLNYYLKVKEYKKGYCLIQSRRYIIIYRAGIKLP